MRRIALAVLALVAGLSAAHANDPKPNILLILADDLGFSDLGCYGSEIETPHLDALAKNGLRYTQFTNTARCWPTRGAILTGFYAQQIRRDALPNIKSGNQGKRPDWAILLPEMLKAVGYRSYHSGKWHVDGTPIDGGFDRSEGMDNHNKHFFKPPGGTGAETYSSTVIADNAIRHLDEHFTKDAAKPFFSFVAFTAPHFPVQAYPADTAKYRERYLAGWDKLREERWARMKALGIPGGLPAIEREVGPPYAFADVLTKLGPNEVNRPVAWDTLTAEQKKFQADKMAVHAAMVDRMDREIGRIIAKLRDAKVLDNTLIMFLSDNGASAEMMVRGDGHDPHAECGTGATFLCIGPGWSGLCNTPFRRHKTWVHEGGISTSLVVHWPKGIAAKNEVRHTPGHVVDFVPTALELTGAKPHPKAPSMSGRSLVASFAKDATVDRESIWWLHENNKAIRVGNWKLVIAAKDKNPTWELYDLSKDRTESNNLAAQMPEKVKELAAAWQAQYSQAISRAKP